MRRLGELEIANIRLMAENKIASRMNLEHISTIGALTAHVEMLRGQLRAAGVELAEDGDREGGDNLPSNPYEADPPPTKH
jgi:hypothetical protein